MYFIVLTLGLVGSLWLFKRMYLKIAIMMFIVSIKLYLFVKQQFVDTRNDIRYIQTRTNTNSSVDSYRVTYNEKTFQINVVNTTINKKPKRKLTMNDVRECIKHKNKIVHCSIVNDDGDIVLDATTYVREFVLYFESSTEESRLHYFISYLEDIHGMSLSEYKLMIYLNDEFFTERTYVIQERRDSYLKDILV